ncbi:MAG: hypothetical protein RL534_829 [Actinomycetota bacterium]
MKIFASLLIASLTLAGCANKDPNALPNDGIVKECSEMNALKSKLQSKSKLELNWNV